MPAVLTIGTPKTVLELEPLAGVDRVLPEPHGFDQIVGVEIPTGNPLLIELDAALKPVSARYLDESRAEKLPVA